MNCHENVMNVEGRKGSLRPKKRWIGYVMNEMKEKRVDEGMADDRDLWQNKT